MEKQSKPLSHEEQVDILVSNKKATILATLRKTAGNVAAACKAANVARSSFYNYVNDDPDFKQAVADVKEELIDMAESALFSLIQDKNPTGIIFYLKTQGKERGYGDAVELTGKNGKDLIPDTARFMPESITINVVGDDKSKD